MNVSLPRIFIAWPILTGLPLIVIYGHLLKYSGVERDGLMLPAVVLAMLSGATIALLRLSWLEHARGQILRKGLPLRPQDGEYVAAGGRLRAGAHPLLSPLTGGGCGLHAWTIGLRKRRQGVVVIGQGSALADAVIDSPRGWLTLSGRPEVEELDWQFTEDPAMLARLAQAILADGVSGLSQQTGKAALANARLQPDPASVDDGIDFRGGFSGGVIRASDLIALPLDEIRARHDEGDPDGAARQLAECLHAIGCVIHLAALPVGAEITAVGRWSDAQGRLAIKAQAGASRWHGVIGLAASTIAARGKRRARRALVTAGLLGLAAAGVLVYSVGSLAH